MPLTALPMETPEEKRDRVGLGVGGTRQDGNAKRSLEGC